MQTSTVTKGGGQNDSGVLWYGMQLLCNVAPRVNAASVVSQTVEPPIKLARRWPVVYRTPELSSSRVHTAYTHTHKCKTDYSPVGLARDIFAKSCARWLLRLKFHKFHLFWTQNSAMKLKLITRFNSRGEIKCMKMWWNEIECKKLDSLAGYVFRLLFLTLTDRIKRNQIRRSDIKREPVFLGGTENKVDERKKWTKKYMTVDRFIG